MKKTLTIFVLALGSLTAVAQQDPQFSQYMHNKVFMNPAYAGMRRALCLSLIARNQWTGFEGAPQTGVFSGDIYFPGPGKFGSGVGLNVMYDKLGFEKNFRFDLDYSFHIEMGTPGTLAIGLQLGAFNKQIGGPWVATQNWMTDQAIPPTLTSTKFDFGMGLWYQRQNIWFGLSSTHLAPAKFSGTSSPISTGGPPQTYPLNYQMARHYFITGGINIWQGNIWEIRPSFLVKTDATITTFDLNVTALYNQRFWFGASYRMQDAIIPMIGFQLPLATTTPDERPGGGLKVGFAYDFTTSSLKNYSSGTFELYVNYCRPLTRKTSKTGHGDTRIFD